MRDGDKTECNIKVLDTPVLGDRADYLWKLELSIKDVTSGKTKYAYFFCHFKYILLVDSQQSFRIP